MNPLAIEFITLLGMNPVRHVDLAARLGVTHLGFAPAPIAANPHGYAAWDLRSDPGLLRDTKAALLTHGLSVSLGEGFLIMPGMDMADFAPVADVMAELGAPMLNAISMEQDRPRALDQFAAFAAMGAARGMTVCLEFMPLMWPLNIGEAVQFVIDSGAPDATVLLDAMHFFRGGSRAADLAAIDPARIGYVQICDVPMPAINPDYGMEARDNRLPPGAGDLPLAELIAALPHGVTIGLELPMAAQAEAGVAPEARLAPAIASARHLLAGRL